MSQGIAGEQRRAAATVMDKMQTQMENVQQLRTLRTSLETCMGVLADAGLVHNGRAQETSFYVQPPRTVPFDTKPGSDKTAAYATLRIHAKGWKAGEQNDGAPYSDHDKMVSFLAFDNQLYIADRNTTQDPACRQARIMCIYTPTRKSEDVMSANGYESALKPLHKGAMDVAPFAIADSLAESLVRPMWGEEKAVEVKALMIQAMLAPANPSGALRAQSEGARSQHQQEYQVVGGSGQSPLRLKL